MCLENKQVFIKDANGKTCLAICIWWWHEESNFSAHQSCILMSVIKVIQLYQWSTSMCYWEFSVWWHFRSNETSQLISLINSTLNGIWSQKMKQNHIYGMFHQVIKCDSVMWVHYKYEKKHAQNRVQNVQLEVNIYTRACRCAEDFDWQMHRYRLGVDVM